MQSKVFDIGIIGGGIAGAFASLRIAEKHRNAKTVLFELGKRPGKRRRQLEGWLGCFPTGDGKIYVDDVNSVLDVADSRKTKTVDKWFMNHLGKVNPMKVITNKTPASSVLKAAKENEYELEIFNYIQWRPESIHQLSKIVSEAIEDAGNVEFSFDNEVYNVSKYRKEFILETKEGEYRCKKLIICAGRSGWRWANKLYRNFGILSNDDVAMFGLRIEISAQYMKDFNKCHCSLYGNNVEIGPLNWFGTVIPEDHDDLVISAFRSNEDRWKSDKVSFSLIGHREFEGAGCYQTDRLAKLAFLLSDDRIGKEKIVNFIKGKSELSNLPEYDWFIEALNKLESVMPAIISRGYFHVPDIISTVSEVKVGDNLESEVDGMFVAGESLGIRGIAAAGITGAVAADGACK